MPSLAAGRRVLACGELPDVQIVLGVAHRLRQRLQPLDLHRTDRSTACRPASMYRCGNDGKFLNVVADHAAVTARSARRSRPGGTRRARDRDRSPGSPSPFPRRPRRRADRASAASRVPSDRETRRMPGFVRIDVIELVHDRIELRHPSGRAGIEVAFARARERLVAEARQHERDQVLDCACRRCGPRETW